MHPSFSLSNARASEPLRPVPGYEGHYSVTDDGRVWSHRKTTGRAHAGRFLSPTTMPVGYRYVSLSKGGQRRKQYVHRLVALAWVPNPDPASRTHINHRNGVKADNRAGNLEWVSQAANNAHAVETGLRRYPVAVPLDQLGTIRARLDAGETHRSVAQSYRVSRSTISYIAAGKYALSAQRLQQREPA